MAACFAAVTLGFISLFSISGAHGCQGDNCTKRADAAFGAPCNGQVCGSDPCSRANAPLWHKGAAGRRRFSFVCHGLPSALKSKRAMRSRATESLRTVVVALVANLGTALAKLLAAIFTGSSAMWAEAFHACADTGN
jgi:hypothetical protein